MTYLQSLKDQQHLGTSDPDPEPRQHYEVHCGKCHWWGYESQLRKIYTPIPTELGGVTPELCCPICREAGWLEFADVATIVIDSASSTWNLIRLAELRNVRQKILEETLRQSVSLGEFTSILSYQLGVYIGDGLFKNYPANFNALIPKLAKELFNCQKKSLQKK